MTWYQILALLTAGPLGFLNLMRALAAMQGKTSFHLIQAFFIFLSALLIVLAFTAGA